MRAFRADQVPAPKKPHFEEALALAETGPALDLEIGCGVGWHPIQYAKLHPGRALIAIEHTATKFDAFRTRVRRNAPLPNLLAVHANAISWLAHAPASLTFDRVLFMYPNPEPQNPAKRWIRMPFFGLVLERMRRGGEILLVTNEEKYAREIESEAVTRWRLAPPVHRTIAKSTQPEFKPRTHFEKKYFLRGETLHELSLSV